MEHLVYESNELLGRLHDAVSACYTSSMPMANARRRLAQLRRLRAKAYERLCRRLDVISEELAEIQRIT